MQRLCSRGERFAVAELASLQYPWTRPEAVDPSQGDWRDEEEWRADAPGHGGRSYPRRLRLLSLAQGRRRQRGLPARQRRVRAAGRPRQGARLHDRQRPDLRHPDPSAWLTVGYGTAWE